MLWLFKNDPIFNKSVKIRPVEEIINIQLFRPLAHIILLLIKNKPIKPETIVLIHTILVIISSVLIFICNDTICNWVIFSLLQLKTILDNLDGQLARFKNLHSILGRYLDTLMDYLGNLCLFISIGLKYNLLITSLTSFYILTIVLSYDFNLEKLYKKHIKNENHKSEEKLSKIESLLKNLYEIILGHQDKLITKLEYSLSQKLNNNELFWKKEYLHITANMGLSTQLFILGILILLGKPHLYLFFPILCIILIAILLIFRIFIVLKRKKINGE